LLEWAEQACRKAEGLGTTLRAKAEYVP
jgi:hypothetical protein